MGVYNFATGGTRVISRVILGSVATQLGVTPTLLTPGGYDWTGSGAVGFDNDFNGVFGLSHQLKTNSSFRQT